MVPPLHYQADRVQAEPYLDALRRDGDALCGRADNSGFAHGDFHSQNLIIGGGEVTGLDFTEAATKLCVYDIVDFLKEDAQCPAAPGDLDRSGIRRAMKQMFFKLYRHPVDPAVLGLCLRGRLLIDWLSVTRERFQATQYYKAQFDRLQMRVQAAFAEPIRA